MKAKNCGTRYALGLLTGVVAALAFAQSGAAAGPPLKVCGSGCPYTTVTAALAAAPDGAAIQIGAGTYEGALDINKNLTLQGAGAGATTLRPPVPTSWSDGATVVVVEPGVEVTVRGVTLTGGSAYFGGPPSCYSGESIDCQGGGAVRNSGNLTLVGDVLDRNLAGPPLGGGGGGIFNTRGASLTVIGTTISHNRVTESGLGGGIFNRGSAVITNSVIVDNSASFESAIANDGTMLLRNTTVSRNIAPPFVMQYAVGVGNSGTLVARDSVFTDNSPGPFPWAGIGGGIANSGTATFYGCTVARNTARYGGGFFNAGALTLFDTSVTDNTATGTGGGIYNLNGRGTLALHDSVVSGNTGGDIIFGPEPSWP
jgi:hypothetical protein